MISGNIMILVWLNGKFIKIFVVMDKVVVNNKGVKIKIILIIFWIKINSIIVIDVSVRVMVVWKDVIIIFLILVFNMGWFVECG